MLESHKPYPAFALDRHWNIVASNRALQPMYEGVAPELLASPVNAMRLSLHPQGVAPASRISANGALICCTACAGNAS